jgi:hypothetical protein
MMIRPAAIEMQKSFQARMNNRKRENLMNESEGGQKMSSEGSRRRYCMLRKK